MESGQIQLVERVMSSAGLADRIDEANGVIRGVKVLGRVSANGREYTREAVRNAASKYEGRPVYVDHRRSGDDRSSRDKFGWFENVKPDANDELYGDFHYLKTHVMAAPTIEAARRRPQLFGFSHDAVGTPRPGSNDTIIESIDEVSSVDLVDSPATTNGIFENRGKPMNTPVATPIAKNRPKTATGQRTRKTLRAILCEALMPRVAKKKRDAVRTWLKEADDVMSPDEPMEATPGAAGEDLDAEPPAHGAELMQAIIDLIDGCLENADQDSLNPEYVDKLKQIRDIAGSHAGVGSNQNDDDTDGTPGASGSDEIRGKNQAGQRRAMWAKDPENPYSDSRRYRPPAAGQSALQEQLRQLRAENTAIRLASEAGIKLTSTQLKALAHLSEAEIKTAIDEQKAALTEAATAASKGGATAPARTTPPSRDAGGRTDVTTPAAAAPKDAKEFLSVLEQRARKK